MTESFERRNVRSTLLYYARELLKFQAGFAVAVSRNYCRKLTIAYGFRPGGVAERFRGVERTALKENLVRNRTITPAANISKRSGCYASFIAEKNNDDARHRLLGVHGLAITLGENVLRECELALAQNCAGNRAVRLSEYEERRLPF